MWQPKPAVFWGARDVSPPNLSYVMRSYNPVAFLATTLVVWQGAVPLKQKTA